MLRLIAAPEGLSQPSHRLHPKPNPPPPLSFGTRGEFQASKDTLTGEHH